VDKSKARIFEVFLGEIAEHTEIEDEIPRKAKTGGWKGNEEGRNQRHLTEEVHRHFKRVADALMDSFKLYHFDSLILGGHRPDFSEFESELHPFLKDKIIGRLELDLHASQEAVLEKAMHLEQMVHKENSGKLVKRLTELTGERMAVTGILATLTVHRRGQIHQLVVNNNYQVSGAKCSSCGYLDQEIKDCPICKKPLGQIPDLVDDLIESVISQGGKVEYVWNNDQMKQLGGVGAILRFKL
jgi:peptide chain release factor subunit 1